MKPKVFVQVGARTEGGGAVRARVRLLAAVGAGVLGETRRHAEAFATDPAAKGPRPAVDSHVVLQMGQLAEALPTCGALLEDGEKPRK